MEHECDDIVRVRSPVGKTTCMKNVRLNTRINFYVNSLRVSWVIYEPSCRGMEKKIGMMKKARRASLTILKTFNFSLCKHDAM